MRKTKTVPKKGRTGECATINKPIVKMKIGQESSDALWNHIDLTRDLSVERRKELSELSKKIKVLRYKDNKLYYTDDLSIFKKCDYNRDISIKGAMKIIESVRRCSTWLNQIVKVNPQMEVISGQNTLVAAYILGIGVYYVISEDHNPELLVGGEVANRWTDLASLKTYAKTNAVAQKFYKFFIDVNKDLRREKVKNGNGKLVNKYKNVTLPQLLAIIYKEPHFVYGIKANGGSHVLNQLKDFDTKNEEILKAIKIVGLAQKVCAGDGIKRYPFLVGLLNFMYNNQDGIDVDFNKLLKKISVLRVSAGKSEDYYRQVKTVYV